MAEKTKVTYKGYGIYLTHTGWRTYPGYDDVRFSTLEAAKEAIDGWMEY